MRTLCLVLSCLLGTEMALAWCTNSTQLTRYNGAFQSPLYPNFYPTDLRCVWKITAPDFLHIKVSFTYFDVEKCGEEDCTCDALTFYDVTEAGGNVTLARYCGNSLPNAVYSRGSTLLVVFSSDNGEAGFGFRAEYTMVQRGAVCSSQPLEMKNEGTFMSPANFQSKYPPNSKCIWLITAANNTRIELNFLSFKLQNCTSSFTPCGCDYVNIIDGSSSSDFLIGRYCGLGPATLLYSSGPYLRIEFTSDGSGSDKGFAAEFSSRENVKTSCPASWQFPFKCPENIYRSNKSTVCCHANGPGCCVRGGSYCSDKWSAARNYCPRPSDPHNLTRCCSRGGQAACCVSGTGSMLFTRRSELIALFLTSWTVIVSLLSLDFLRVV